MRGKEKQVLKDFWIYWRNRNGKKCFNCDRDATNRAHLIGQGKMSRSKWSNDIIDNPLDWLPSCDKCNDLIDIGQNLNAIRVATVLMSHLDESEKREAIENIVRENIKRKVGKCGTVKTI